MAAKANKEKRPRGRPTTYSAEWRDKVAEAVAGGSNLLKLSKRKGWPSLATLYLWLRTHDDFSESYARAKEDRADTRADKMDEISEQVKTGKITPEQGRVMADIVKWQTGNEKGGEYAQRLRLDHGGQKDNPVKSEAEVKVTPTLDMKGLSDEQLRAIGSIFVHKPQT